MFELEFLRDTETMYHEEALRIMRDSQFTVSVPCNGEQAVCVPLGNRQYVYH